MTKKHEQRSLANDENDELPAGDALDLPFEEAIAELETLVGELEDGKLPLEGAMERFERGLALVRTCQTKLKQAELRVSELLDDDTLDDEDE